MKKTKSFLSFVFIVSCQFLFVNFFQPSSLSAQRNNFQNFSIKDHLPQSTINCIAQDKGGYLWLGTGGGGLCRYDGIGFETIDRQKGFNADIVKSILQDSKGRIWAGTSGEGIIVYDGFKPLTLGKKNGLAGKNIICLLEDKNGIFWAGTDDGGLNKITEIKKDSFRIEVIDENKGLSSNGVFDVHEDKNGRLWLATFGGGINILSPSKTGYDITQLRGGREIPSNEILCIAEDLEGAMWFGTLKDGVFKIAPSQMKTNSLDFRLEVLSRKITTYNKRNGFDADYIWKIFLSGENELWFASPESGIIRQKTFGGSKNEYYFEHYTDKEGLPGKGILCFYEDTKGNIWVGTAGYGLSKFMGNKFSNYTKKDGLSSDMIYGVGQDSVGNIWIAAGDNGLDKMKLIRDIPTVTNYNTKDGLSGNKISSIYVGKTYYNQQVWCAIDGQGISKFNGKKFSNFYPKDGLIDNSGVYSVFVDSKGIVWCGTKEGISLYDGKRFLNKSMEDMKFADKDVNTIIEDRRGHIWFGTGGGLARYAGHDSLTTYDEEEGLANKEILSLAEGPNGNIWIGTKSGGLYMFDIHTKDIKKIHRVANDSLLSSNTINSLLFQNNHILIVGTDKGFDKINFGPKWNIVSVRNYDASDGFTGVECNDNALYMDREGSIWFGTVKGLTRYNPSAERINNSSPQTHISQMLLNNKPKMDWINYKGVDSVSPFFGLPYNLKLPYNENRLTFKFTAIALDNPQKVKFRYKLEGLEEEWSSITTNSERDYPSLPPGNYRFKVIAAGANGIWSMPAALSFTINPPWYRTTWFYITCFVLVIISIYSFIKYRERALINEKNILENKVQERTFEVVKQKEEIEKQKELIEEKNKDITDSINYAERIQQAILPEMERIRKAFPQSFILFQPRDIVSGDFYWYNELEENGNPKYLLAAADCTGHGVPGAFMSMINSSLLNETVNGKKIFQPNEILNEVRRGIISSLKQTGKSGGQKDGMDIALVSLTYRGEKVILEYAGANNSIYIIRKPEEKMFTENAGEIDSKYLVHHTVEAVLEEIDPDSMPVSIADVLNDFKNNIIDLKKGDCIYIFTDGYADQFGGPKGKKFKYPPLKQVLLSVYDKSPEEQKEILHTTITDWKGNLEQVDDILLIGVRL